MSMAKTIVPSEEWCISRVSLSPLKPPAYITQDSLPSITYKLYPFEQCKEVRLDQLFYEVPMKELRKIKFQSSMVSRKDQERIAKELNIEAKQVQYSYSWEWFDKNVYVLLGQVGQFAIIYQVVCMETKQILSCLVDKSFALQEGDGETIAYCHSNHFYISNEGDVSSIVVITMLV